MLNLLRFEIQRKWKLLISILIGYGIINFALALKQRSLVGDYLYNSLDSIDILFEGSPTYLILMILLASFLTIIAIIDAINLVRLEVKNQTRDLYFAIPLHASKKLGAKYIIGTLQIFFASLIGALGVVAGIQYITGFKIFEEIFNLTNGQFFNILFISLFCIVVIAQFLGIIYLTFSLYRSFFGQYRFGTIITIVIFGILMYLYDFFLDLLFNPFNSLFIESFDMNLWQTEGLTLLLLTLILGVIFCTTSYLFEKRINLD